MIVSARVTSAVYNSVGAKEPHEFYLEITTPDGTYLGSNLESLFEKLMELFIELAKEDTHSSNWFNLHDKALQYIKDCKIEVHEGEV